MLKLDGRKKREKIITVQNVYRTKIGIEFDRFYVTCF